MRQPSGSYGQNVYEIQQSLLEFFAPNNGLDRRSPSELSKAFDAFMKSLDERITLTIVTCDLGHAELKHQYETALFDLKNFSATLFIPRGMQLGIMIRLVSKIFVIGLASGKCANPRLTILLELADIAEYPSMGFCSNNDSCILVPDHYFISTVGYAQFRATATNEFVPWQLRKRKVVWRGSSTGIPADIDCGILDLSDDSSVRALSRIPRLFMCYFIAKSRCADFCDVGISKIVQISDQDTIDSIYRFGLLKNPIGKTEFGLYKYAIDIDGNSNAWDGLFTNLFLGCCVLKVSSPHGYRQWFYDRLVPWTNFVPIASRLENFDDTLDHLLADDVEVERIAAAGAKLAMEMTFDRELETAAVRIAELMSADAERRRPFRNAGATLFRIEFPD